jgi:hypothetical protein
MRCLSPVFFLLFLFGCKETITDPPPNPVLEDVQSIVNMVDMDSLSRTIRDLTGESDVLVNGELQRIVSRRTGSEGNMLASQYLLDRLRAYGLSAELYATSISDPNVIATKPGSNYPDRRIILCAHFDNVAQTDTVPGADDNASGTAAVIEAARILSGYRTDATIIFALFNEEEQGLIGSSEYALQYKTAEFEDTYVINLDMIGWDADNDHVAEIHARDVGRSPALADTLVYLNAELGIGLNTMVYNPGTAGSDHASFWAHGRSAVLIIEESYGGDFNAFYHSPNDLFVHFNLDFYKKCARLAIGSAAMMAGVSVSS